MSYTTAEGRQELLESLAEAIVELGFALAALGAAYEQLDVMSADKLEEELFGPVQRAYGRAKKTYAAFAERAGLEADSFAPQEAGLPSTGAIGFIGEAVNGIAAAGGKLTTLQDSPALLEVAHVARDLLRRLGR